MSHGGGGLGKGQVSSDPNLTPLLDLVLQLVMFFMLVANFVMDQVNETIKLPVAIEAKALDKTVDAYVILNVNQQGKVLLGRSEDANVLEGAIFAFVEGTDPEAFLLLEAAPESKPNWKFAFARMNIVPFE